MVLPKVLLASPAMLLLLRRRCCCFCSHQQSDAITTQDLNPTKTTPVHIQRERTLTAGRKNKRPEFKTRHSNQCVCRNVKSLKREKKLSFRKRPNSPPTTTVPSTYRRRCSASTLLLCFPPQPRNSTNQRTFQKSPSLQKRVWLSISSSANYPYSRPTPWFPPQGPPPDRSSSGCAYPSHLLRATYTAGFHGLPPQCSPPGCSSSGCAFPSRLLRAIDVEHFPITAVSAGRSP